MSINGVMSAGLQGMAQSQRQMTQAATDIARIPVSQPSVDLQDVSEPLIAMRQEQHIFDASAKVVSVADKALGALLDTHA